VTRFLQGIQLGIRSLRRTPGFAVTSILTLALGIGLSTAVFTVADALLLRRLAVKDQERIVILWGEMGRGGFDHYPLGLADAREFVRVSHSLERAAFVTYEGAWPTSIQYGAEVSRLRRAVVSGDFFAVLGAQPLLGRALRAADDASGATPVLVLNYGTWKQRFGGDPHVLGRQVLNFDNGVTYTIVGVMPQGLDYPRGTDAWVPVLPTIPAGSLEFAAFDVIGRLAPGVALSAARDEMTAFLGRVDASTWQRDLRGVALTLPRLVLGDVRPALFAFAVAAGLLLLITCTNVANLLLVRGLERVREIAIRSALGAARSRVIAQLLAENALLAVAGGALGVLVAAVTVRIFLVLAPTGLPRLEEIQLNGTALAAAVGITGFAMLIFGLGPAIITSQVDLQQVLRSATRQSQSRHSRLAAEGLVAGQVALAVVVLAAAGLVARSLIKLERAELSFKPAGLLIGELAVRSDQYDDAEKQSALLDRILTRLQMIPGVRSVSPVVAVPFSGTGGWDGRAAAEGQSEEAASANPMMNMEVVAPDYFKTLGIPILRGRGFTNEDRRGDPNVVVVSQSAARYYWPGADPIGKRLKVGADSERTMTVVGLVPDTRYRDLRDARSSIYFPLLQSFFAFAPTTLAIRAAGPPDAVVPAIRRAIDEAGSGVALASIAPFSVFLDGPLAQPRLNAVLLALFASTAVLLAAVGLYGVMETMVRQRRRELAVRMALGATPAHLRRMVVQRGFIIATAGTILGLLGAFMINRLVLTLLYEVSPTDSATLGIIAGLFLGVATLASFWPARSTTRIDPALALKAEG